ncbi:MAG: hypothetical protein H0T08_08140 [Acidobacteria bacterium]|nr:hypothetical protein [Acidobacteriota bacterium]
MKTTTKFSFGLLVSTALTGAAFAQTPTSTPVKTTETTTKTTTTTPTTPTTTTKKTITTTPTTTTMETPTTTTTTTMKTDVVQNSDGSYSVIEYPVGKEVVVEFMPTDKAMTAKGLARVMRMGEETTINFDLNGLDASSNYHAYAVDPAGNSTYLGPIKAENGIAKTSFKTPSNQFMLVLSPTEGLTTIGTDTAVAFRSAVPKGFAVVNNRATTTVAEGKQVAETQGVDSTYEVPLLGVSGFKKGETEIRVNFSGELEGLKGKAYIDSSKQGVSKIKMRFDDMKLAPKEKRYVLWAVSSTKEYTKIGQVINTGKRQESEIRGETALQDFGLFVTVEDKDVLQPTSRIFSAFSLK